MMSGCRCWLAAVVGLLREKRLVPIWVSDPAGVVVPPALGHLTVCRVDNLEDGAAERALVSAVAGAQRPSTGSLGPGEAPAQQRPRLPNSLPRVWNIADQECGVFGPGDCWPGWAAAGWWFSGRGPRPARYGRGGEVAAGRGVRPPVCCGLRPGVVGGVASSRNWCWSGSPLSPSRAACFAGHAGAGGRGRVREHLRGSGRWLMVFDNAEDPAAIRAFLPEGPGHVLITSRNPAWM